MENLSRTATIQSPPRFCCSNPNQTSGIPPAELKRRVCGPYCLNTVSARELTEARKRARLIVLEQWLPVDRWLDLMETAHYVDATATRRGWKSLKRDPFNQIRAEVPEVFFESVGRLHAHLQDRGIRPIPAIAALTNAPDQLVALWVYAAQQRGHIAPDPEGGDE